jgi:predicted P-loop ATPase
MSDKTAAEKVQGNWLMEISELAGIRKADQEKIKAFVSRTDDKYRASFGRRVTSHPRQCVLFATTNSDRGYLRDTSGNRRFWTVRTPRIGKRPAWTLTDEEIKQIWAEAYVYTKADETLYLDPELEAVARAEQRAAMEHDDREGLVREYLDKLLPETWDRMDIYTRREYIRDADNPTSPAGKVRRVTVSNMEIWCECFGKNKEDMQPKDSYSIAAIMQAMDDWERPGQLSVLNHYGRQRIYTRK